MTDSRRLPRSQGLSAGIVLWLLAACHASEQQREYGVVDAVQQGQYGQALERARRQAEANPQDALAQQVYRDAKLAFILNEGREEVFHGDLTRGLALEEARAIAPEHPTVLAWIRKTRAQLAVEWLDRAAEQSGPEQLDEAERSYEKVLEYDAANAAARSGLAHVLLLKNYRGGMSKTYFDDGLSSFRELQFQQARRAFQISRRYRENEPAVLRADEVEKLMAEERLAQAKELEAAGRFFAARNEYRLVLIIEPDNAEGRAGLDRMDREARAVSSLSKADMALRRGAYSDAEENLEAAKLLTDVQKDELSLLQSGIEEQRLDDLYREAMGLVQDNRYPEAVTAFDALLALEPDYKDALRRKNLIEEWIMLAEEFYPLAVAAESDEQAEGYLRAIHLVWPEYKDVAQRLREIGARRAESEPPEAPAPESAEPGAVPPETVPPEAVPR